MEPEISHRCPACGVAVRGTSLFCPQCGKPLKANATSGGGKSAEVTEATARAKPDTGLNTSALAPSPNLAETMPGKDALKPDAAVVENKLPTVGTTVPLSREVEERAARQRATPVAYDGAEGKKIAPRVEKLRHASSAMLEEASSDPSLRFVLVAIVVFLLTLLLLLLNHLLG
jgi:uncharacterized Zn finger protein (UPF0148 family)